MSTEKCVLKGSFGWRIFFHFWLTEIKQVNLIQSLRVWSGFLKKKENERTLIKHFRLSFCTPWKHIWLWSLSKARLLQVTHISINWVNFVCFDRSTTPAWGGEAVAQCQAVGIFWDLPLPFPLPSHPPIQHVNSLSLSEWTRSVFCCFKRNHFNFNSILVQYLR